MTILKHTKNIAKAIFLALLLLLNLRLYFPVAQPLALNKIPSEVEAELRYLRHALDNGAGAEMQQLFPEGDFFLHVLYGLSSVNVGLQLPLDSPKRMEALDEARWAWRQLGEQPSVAPFVVSQSLEPEYGIFYTGWRTYLLAGILLLQDPAQLDGDELAQFEADCAAIALALEQNDTPFLQAYPHAAWPVDMFPAMAALGVHGKVVNGRYQPLVDEWVVSLNDYLDPETGLIPHRVHPQTGEMIQPARATSQTLILRFLADIDPELGQAHYEIFREQYVGYIWGLPGVLEYPRGVAGQGDVDSGPLVAGVSLSATAVFLGTSQLYNDTNISEAIWHAGELAGIPFRFNGMKRYWFGLLPVGDAFGVWGKTAVSWIAPPITATYSPIVPWWWRLVLHLFSLILALPFAKGFLLTGWETRQRRRLYAHS